MQEESQGAGYGKQLVPAGETQWSTPLPAMNCVTSRHESETGHCRAIFTTEIGKCYGSGLSPLSQENLY